MTVMGSKKKVSVIMPYYKKKTFFYNSYNSVITQSYKNIEVIIIFDDQDKTDLSYIKSIIYKNSNTKLIVNKKNFGVAKSRNLGILISKGYYISFIDCDDLWNKDKLLYQLKYMKLHNLRFLYSSYDVIDENNKSLYKIKAYRDLSYNDLLKSCDIGLSSVILEKQLLKNNLFKNLRTKEDYLLWLTLAKKGVRLNHYKKFLVSWRLCKNSLSSNNLQKIKDAFKVYSIYQNQNIFRSLIYVLILSYNALKKNYRRYLLL
jgi:teichuronic acid biosynthesis glycosyltransferase TuaG